MASMRTPASRRGILRGLLGLSLVPLLGPRLAHGRSRSTVTVPVARSPATPEAAGAQADHFIGEIRLVPYTFAPRGWAFCQGQLLPVSSYQALFSLVGTQYGGDGRRSFALPDLRRVEQALRELSGTAQTYRHVIALTGLYPSRS